MVNVKPLTLVWMDSTRKASLPNALSKLNLGKYKPLHTLQMPGKFQRGRFNYWLSFNIKNPSSDTIAILCHALGLSGDSAWVFENQQMVSANAIKDPALQDSFGILRERHFSVFVFKLPPSKTYQVLLKIWKPNMATDFSPSVSEARSYEAWRDREIASMSLMYLLSIGMMLALLIFTFSLYLSTRDNTVLWYCLYNVSILFVGWRNFEDYNYHFMWTLQYMPWKYVKAFQSAAVFITYVNFIRFFFNEQPAILKKIARAVVCISIGGIVLDLILLNTNEYLSWLTYYWIRIVVSLLGLFTIFAIWRTPHPLGKYILTGSLSLVVSEMISWFFPVYLTSQVGLVGVLVELLFFTYALGIRVRLELHEKSSLKFANELLKSEKQLETERLRTRIAQDIHDEVGSSLTKISLAAQIAARLPHLGEAEVKNRFEKLGADARSAAGQLREIVFAINPDFDRFDEMQSYFRESAREFWQEMPVELHFDFETTPDTNNPLVPPDVKRQLLLIFKEAQNNAAKHSSASEVWLTLHLTSLKHYLLKVQDNGKGFSMDSTRPFSNGLSGMKRRADSIGADFSVKSELGKGTEIAIMGCLKAQG